MSPIPFPRRSPLEFHHARTDPLTPSEKRQIKKRGIVYATGGLLLALAVVLALRYVGVGAITYRGWALAVGVTLAVQSILWLVPHLGWDEKLTIDPHYLYLPMLVAAGLMAFYIYLVPEARYLLLMAWFVALLFAAGLVGFMEVAGLSLFMATGYMVSIGVLIARGEALSVAFEGIRIGVFLAITLYAGVVFQRLRRERDEMKLLRNQLAERALTDPLTGLPNRRYFEDILKAELARIRRYGGACSVAMLDVDFFKNYNDTLGHLAGDGVLRELADVFREHMRVSDVAARYGGEEFAVIMVNTEAEDALEVVDRLRSLVEEHPFRDEHVQPRGQLTISGGIASSPDDADTYEDLVRKADEALYEAKKSGRNRVHRAA